MLLAVGTEVDAVLAAWPVPGRLDGAIQRRRPYHRVVTGQGGSPPVGPSVCPFVALAEDRDRRADAPDEGNRCYAERAPRQRDMVYQVDYCYTAQFSQCSVFLGWAARNAAQPADVTEAAQRAANSGIAPPPEAVSGATAEDGDAATPTPSPEGGLFGAAEPVADGAKAGNEQLDWVSASAWAEAPWDELAEQEAEELDSLVSEEVDDEPEDEPEPPRGEEATQAPKVPAAIPVRRRKRAQPAIRSRGSGEWFYADPPGHEPLVKRRSGVAPPILLGVLGLLIAALVVFLIPTLFFGGNDDDGRVAAVPSASTGASRAPLVTRAPVVASAAPSVQPSAAPTPRPETHKVKRRDTLISIAEEYGVKAQHIQCLNGIRDRNIVVLGAIYKIPPEGFKCPPGWRDG